MHVAFSSNNYYGAPLQCFRLRSWKIGVSTFGDRCVDLRRSTNDVSTVEDRCTCVDFRRSMCLPSGIDVSTFEDRCFDLRGSHTSAPVALIAKNLSYFNEIHCKPQVTIGINYILHYKLNISKHQSYGNSL